MSYRHRAILDINSTEERNIDFCFTCMHLVERWPMKCAGNTPNFFGIKSGTLKVNEQGRITESHD